MKKERKKAEGKDSKKNKGKPKDTTKRAHTTVAEEDYDDDSSDDESEGEGTANVTSFSCICATRSSTVVSESLVYFDNCSNLNIIKDK